MPSESYAIRATPDSDAPELYGLAASKESEKRKNEEIEQAHAALRRQTKRKNQERDRVLKEQAQRRKEKENGGNAGRSTAASSIEARMERAMEEAQEEDSESSEWGGIGGGFGAEPTPEMDADDEDEDMEDVQNESCEQTSDEDDSDYGAEIGSVMQKSINRLPDHLFEAAFASQKAQLEASASTIQNPTTSEPAASTSARGKKRIRKTQPKDVIIGSRTIRTLLSTLQISKEGAYAPTQKAQKYINRSLALKGGNSRVRGWQRRAANIGVMQHSGPAANFVRS